MCTCNPPPLRAALSLPSPPSHTLQEPACNEKRKEGLFPDRAPHLLANTPPASSAAQTSQTAQTCTQKRRVPSVETGLPHAAYRVAPIKTPAGMRAYEVALTEGKGGEEEDLVARERREALTGCCRDPPWKYTTSLAAKEGPTRPISHARISCTSWQGGSRPPIESPPRVRAKAARGKSRSESDKGEKGAGERVCGSTSVNGCQWSG